MLISHQHYQVNIHYSVMLIPENESNHRYLSHSWRKTNKQISYHTADFLSYYVLMKMLNLSLCLHCLPQSPLFYQTSFLINLCLSQYLHIFNLLLWFSHFPQFFIIKNREENNEGIGILNRRILVYIDNIVKILFLAVNQSSIQILQRIIFMINEKQLL